MTQLQYLGQFSLLQSFIILNVTKLARVHELRAEPSLGFSLSMLFMPRNILNTQTLLAPVSRATSRNGMDQDAMLGSVLTKQLRCAPANF